MQVWFGWCFLTLLYHIQICGLERDWSLIVVVENLLLEGRFLLGTCDSIRLNPISKKKCCWVANMQIHINFFFFKPKRQLSIGEENWLVCWCFKWSRIGFFFFVLLLDNLENFISIIIVPPIEELWFPSSTQARSSASVWWNRNTPSHQEQRWFSHWWES